MRLFQRLHYYPMNSKHSNHMQGYSMRIWAVSGQARMNGSRIHTERSAKMQAINSILLLVVLDSLRQGAFWNTSMADWKSTATTIISNRRGWNCRQTKKQDNKGLDAQNADGLHFILTYFRRCCRMAYLKGLGIGFFHAVFYQLPKWIEIEKGLVIQMGS